ncbi:hypothetical protein [uncultured Tenacibaculum sp.]|uniref:hypothetical protein n=1 Tax=uncultured Tenacibaculum sp. TaxID=174713 RepID=UPI00262AF9FD|nr:hypothetical protein [uncultured Tenacibaculum sp.]
MSKTVKIILALLAFIFISLYFYFKGKYSSFAPVSSTNPLTDLQASKYADELHVAMGSIGTDFNTIESVFSVLDEDSYRQVYNVFGTRGYIDVLGSGTDLPGATQLNLTQWLKSELTSYEVDVVKKNYPFVL